jgi:hypothetical protein
MLARRLERMNAGQAEQLIGSLREIDASVWRMRVWIDELVDVAHLQVGQELDLNRAPTDLVALSRAVAAEYQETCAGSLCASRPVNRSWSANGMASACGG